MDWSEHAEREEARYADGRERMPAEAEARQKQLVRIAMAAGGAGLARLMEGRRAEASGWFTRSALHYRESFADAPPGSWGRLIGALKARLLAGDREGARDDAEWALAQGPAGADSPIGRYAAALAHLILGQDDQAVGLAADLQADALFPPPVADALAALSAADSAAYAQALAAVLASFETREEFLEDVPVADTVLALEALAEPRGLAVRPRSALLPG